MSSRKLYLRESEIEHIVVHCCHSNIPRLIPEVITSTPVELRINLRFEDVVTSKEKPGILLFNFNKGKTSCQIIGNVKYKDIGNSIIDEIEKQAGCPTYDFSSKHITFHNVTREESDIILQYLNETGRYSITKHTGKLDPNVDSSFTISSRFNSHIKLTRYITNTLLMQGCISSLLVEIFTVCSSLLTNSTDNATGTFIELISYPTHEYISSDLTTHFKDLSKFKGTKIEKLLKTSITLLNSEIIIEDYSSMTHGIFRSIEATIAKRISQVSPYVLHSDGKKDSIGRDFNNKIDPIEFKPSFIAFDSKPNLKKAILKAYRHFYKHRNETFHADILVPINTRIINRKEDAIDLAKDSIKMISDIIDYWDE